jgi:hypothetical protein
MSRLSSPTSGDSPALLAELRALRQEVASLRADSTVQNRQIAVNTKNTAETLDKFDFVGLPAERTTA